MKNVINLSLIFLLSATSSFAAERDVAEDAFESDSFAKKAAGWEFAAGVTGAIGSGGAYLANKNGLGSEQIRLYAENEVAKANPYYAEKRKSIAILKNTQQVSPNSLASFIDGHDAGFGKSLYEGLMKHDEKFAKAEAEVGQIVRKLEKLADEGKPLPTKMLTLYAKDQRGMLKAAKIGVGISALLAVDGARRLYGASTEMNPGYNPAIVSSSGAAPKRAPAAAPVEASLGGGESSMDIK